MNLENASIRLRSAQNVSLIGKEFQTVKGRNKVLQPDKPCHKLRDSLLTLSSTSTNYNGTLNLAIVLLVLSNAYIAVENIEKYGLLIDPAKWLKLFFYKLLEFPVILIWLGLIFFALCSLVLEVLLSKGLLSEKYGLTFITFLLASEVVIGPLVVCFTDCYAVAFSITVGFITVFLKLASYHMVNYWCRQCCVSTSNIVKSTVLPDENVRNGDLDVNLVHYPDNLNLKDMFYYFFAPTLCYELNFPHSSCVRKGFLMKCVLEVLLMVLFFICTIQQSIAPVVNDTLNSFQDMGYFKMFEIYLKICIPFALVWLSYAYGFFHSYLNSLAEILRFGDRNFYDDWWNAENQQILQRKWNKPVHNWCFRHLYIPLLEKGFTRVQAVAAVFSISAFFHEYLLSAPLQIFKVWIFVTYHFNMISCLKKDMKNSSKFGNLMLWSVIIFCPPLSTLLYYYYYYIQTLKAS